MVSRRQKKRKKEEAENRQKSHQRDAGNNELQEPSENACFSTDFDNKTAKGVMLFMLLASHVTPSFSSSLAGGSVSLYLEQCDLYHWKEQNTG